MPIYEYRCASCGCQKEYLQKLSDGPMKTCPNCGADALTKLISAVGFQLKGSGWYASDFKGSGAGAAKKSEDTPAAPAGADKKPAEGADSKASTGSDSKASTGSDSKASTSTNSCGGGCSSCS
jgi:putative FmdB family regulatory protein